jgi:hypothetical protein
MQPERRLRMILVEHALFQHERGPALLALRRTLFGRLKQEQHIALQLAAHFHQNIRHPHEHGRVRIVAAGVHHPHCFTSIGGGRMGHERYLGLLGDRQRVHVRAQRHRRPGLAALEKPHHAGVGIHLDVQSQTLQVGGDEF